MEKEKNEYNPVLSQIVNKNPQIAKHKVEDHGKSKVETTNKVSYYNRGYEVIKYIESWDMNFSEGCIIKYISRYKFKGTPLKDLKKARDYINRLIDNLDKDNENK